MKVYVGLDLHSTNCYTVVMDNDSKKVLSRKIPNQKEKIISALAPYKENIEGIAVESTYNWYWLVDALMEEGYKVHLANPAAMKQYEGIKHLDDPHDAFWLANLLKLGILPEGYIYPREIRGVRDTLRQRSRFVRQRTSLKHTLQQIYSNHTGMTLSNNAIPQLDRIKLEEVLGNEDSAYRVERILQTIRFLDDQIKAIENHVENKMKENVSYPLLTTVTGIGKILGLTISLEAGPIERFDSAGQFASYCRCVPTAYWSNEKKKGSGNKKNGNKYLSWAFAEAANFSIRYCKEAKAYHQRKSAKTNLPSAYRAVANKLAKACYFMMKDHIPFDVKRLF